MADNNITDWEKVPISDWEKVPLDTNDTDYSALEAFGQGALDMGSMGFSDEAIGGVKGAYAALTSDEDYLDAYRKARDIEREKQKAAQEQHGVAYGAGGLTGGIASGLATAFVPGLGAATAGKTATQLALQGSKLGALYGLGSTEADLTQPDIEQYKEAAKDVGTSAATGAITGALFPKLFSKDVMVPSNKLSSLVQYGKAAGLGSLMGGTMGAAGSEGSLADEEGISQLQSDTLKGMGLGALGGLAARGISGVGNRLLKTGVGRQAVLAAEETAAGKDIGPDSGYLKETQENVQKLADETAEGVQKVKQSADEVLDAAKRNVEEIENVKYQAQVAEAEAAKQAGVKQLSELEKETQKLLKLEQAKAKADMAKATKEVKTGLAKQAEAKSNDLEKQLVEHSRKVDSSLKAVGDDIGKQIEKQYDIIENTLIDGQTPVTFNVDSVIDSVDSQFKSLGLTYPNQQNPALAEISKFSTAIRSAPIEEGGFGMAQAELPVQELRQFRKVLQAQRETVGGSARKVLGDAIRQLDDVLTGTLDEASVRANDPKLANVAGTLKNDLNPRYHSFKLLEDSLGMSSRELPVSKQQIISKKLPATLRKLISPKAEDITDVEGFSERMRLLGLGDDLAKGKQIAQDIDLSKAIPEEKIQQSLEALPEYQQAAQKAEIDVSKEAAKEAAALKPGYAEAQAKAAIEPKAIPKPSEELIQEGLQQRVAKEAPLSDASKLTGTVAQLEQRVGSLGADKENAVKRMATLIQDSGELIGTNKQTDFETIVDTVKELHGKEAADRFREKAIELSKKQKLAARLNKTSDAKTSDFTTTLFGGFGDMVIELAGTLGKGYGAVNKISPAALASKARNANYGRLADLLEKGGEVDQVRHNAALFSISQNPALRKQYKDLHNKPEE